MSTKYITAGLALGLLLSACSSNPKPAVVAQQPQENVISRIDGLSERPAWLKESEPFKIEAGMVYSLGQTEIPEDHRVNAAYRIAENNAKAAIASSIEQRLEFIFQNAEEGTEYDTTQARYIGAEASSLSTSAIKPAKRYWEKVSVPTSKGLTVVKYRVYSLVSMAEKDFKVALKRALDKGKASKKISPDFAEKVNTHWDSFSREVASDNS